MAVVEAERAAMLLGWYWKRGGVDCAWDSCSAFEHFEIEVLLDVQALKNGKAIDDSLVEDLGRVENLVVVERVLRIGSHGGGL